jgi:predicted TIM-barrel fold metal-dependent hydrolase
VADSEGTQVAKQTIQRDLKDLKMCFGHYGGDDEWERFMESDRDDFAKTLVLEPDHGLRFLYNKEGKSIPGKLEQLWRSGDWYTIISSLMLQYENVYADISYIVHSEKIYPLLKQTLRHKGLREKVLFGTDFYVVRNHKTEKCMLADALAGLDEDEITMIGRTNPWKFLSSSIYSPGVFVYDSKGDTVISKKD